MSSSDFDDFFDSPRRPSNPAPSERIRGSISSEDDGKMDSERNSIISSARSGASIKIEARVPSIASELRSDSDSELEPKISYRSSKPPRPKTNKQKDSVDYKSSKSDKTLSKANAWEEPSDQSNRRMASSIADAKPGDNYISSITGKKMRKGRCQYSDTESDSNSDAYSPNRNPRHKRGTRYRSHSSESCSHSSRSRRSSDSSQWSTGSESGKPKTPRTPGNEGKSYGHGNRKSNVRRARSRSHSDDTLSISSISGSEIDTARPASRSAQGFKTRPAYHYHFGDNSANCLTNNLSSPNFQLQQTNLGARQTSVQPPKSPRHQGEDKDKMNLHRLLAALLENEDEQQRTGHISRHISSSNKDKEASNKGNYTFSGDKARMIDMENQRLLQNILSQRSQGSAVPTTSKAQHQQPNKRNSSIRVTEPPRVTHATLNRMRERQRVERENLALLRRLHQIKPSADVSRKKQLESYNKQMSYHCPQMRTGEAQLRSKSAQGLSNTLSSTGGRSRPSSATHAYRPVSATNSRPSSAHSTTSTVQRRPRPSSAKIRPKPEWENGW